MPLASEDATVATVSYLIAFPPRPQASSSDAARSATAPHLSIVIPAYNEERRLPATLTAIAEFLSHKEYPVEVIVVDDGSRDGTIGVVRHARQQCSANVTLQLLRHKVNRGKGAAVRTGCLAATGRYIVYMDADLATPVDEVEKVLARLQMGYDVVAGTRIQPDGVDARMTQPLWRRVVGKLFTMARRGVVPTEISDTQCPLKGFTHEAAQRLFPLQRTEGWVFDAEILFLARRYKLRIVEVPVRWQHRAGSRACPSLRQALNVAWELFRIRLPR